jgi:uncharacterized protein YeaO (DUF488 family)
MGKPHPTRHASKSPRRFAARPVRRPPRGVPKSDFARLDYYDVWFPNPSPSAQLVKEALGAADQRAWAAFSRKFRREMSEPDRSRELDMLAALSRQTNLSLGCYCADESRCHRSVLRELLAERGAVLRVRRLIVRGTRIIPPLKIGSSAFP